MRFHEYADLFPLLDGAAFESLVADISEHGQREPIWLYKENGETFILDGRNRFLACQKLGLTPKFAEYNGTDPLKFALSMNLIRRQLTASQVAVIALKIEEIEAKRAALRRQATQLAGKDSSGEPVRFSVVANLPPPIEQGKARDLAAAAVGASARNVQKAKAIKKQRPDLIPEIERGDLTLHAAERLMREQQQAADLARPAEIALPPGLYHGDFRELSAQIPDNSVDLVFTDPPYDEDSVALYEDAARVAARILKPGGSMVAYSGQRYLPHVYAAMSKHLRYWWTAAAIHEGGNQMLQKLGIRCGWKPLVWYVKDTRGDVQNVMLDTVRGDREKFAHEWQQAQSEARYFIEKLCSPGGLVVDFFIGGGTTAAAAKSLGRMCIGFEVNAASIERAAVRIAQTIGVNE